MTGTCLYIVIESQGSWWVDCEGKAFGPYLSKQMAEISGVEMARKRGDTSRALEVLSKGDMGLYKILWSSEHH